MSNIVLSIRMNLNDLRQIEKSITVCCHETELHSAIEIVHIDITSSRNKTYFNDQNLI